MKHIAKIGIKVLKISRTTMSALQGIKTNIAPGGEISTAKTKNLISIFDKVLFNIFGQKGPT